MSQDSTGSKSVQTYPEWLGQAQGGGYRATINDYGNGLVEVSGSFVSVAQPASVAARGTSTNLEANLERANASAKKRVRQLVMAGGLDHLLTCTFRLNVTESRDAWMCLEAFVRIVHRRYPLWAYVVRPERQKRGAWHFHLAVKGWQDVNFLRASWVAAVGDLGGNIDVQAPRGVARSVWEVPKLAGYLCKYMCKTVSTERALNEHRFRASLGINVPCRVITLTARSAAAAMEQCAAIVEELGGQVGYVWKTTEGTAWWMCSWG